MTSKIRIKIGDVEVEYEGTEDFLRDELSELLSAVLELHREKGGSSNGVSSNSGTNSSAAENGHGGAIDTGTVTTIAAKLKPSTGPDLANCAATRLIVGLSQPSFTRKELLTEMKSATSYFEQSYANNLSAALKTLISQDKFRKIAKGRYTLSSAERHRLESQLA